MTLSMATFDDFLEVSGVDGLGIGLCFWIMYLFFFFVPYVIGFVGSAIHFSFGNNISLDHC